MADGRFTKSKKCSQFEEAAWSCVDVLNGCMQILEDALSPDNPFVESNIGEIKGQVQNDPIWKLAKKHLPWGKSVVLVPSLIRKALNHDYSATWTVGYKRPLWVTARIAFLDSVNDDNQLFNFEFGEYMLMLRPTSSPTAGMREAWEDLLACMDTYEVQLDKIRSLPPKAVWGMAPRVPSWNLVFRNWLKADHGVWLFDEPGGPCGQQTPTKPCEGEECENPIDACEEPEAVCGPLEEWDSDICECVLVDVEGCSGYEVQPGASSSAYKKNMDSAFQLLKFILETYSIDCVQAGTELDGAENVSIQPFDIETSASTKNSYNGALANALDAGAACVIPVSRIDLESDNYPYQDNCYLRIFGEDAKSCCDKYIELVKALPNVTWKIEGGKSTSVEEYAKKNSLAVYDLSTCH